MRTLVRTALLSGAAAVCLLGATVPGIASAQPSQTVACAALCRAQVSLSGASVGTATGSAWPAAEGWIQITITNTGTVSPPIPITMDMSGETPTFQVRALNSSGYVAAWSTGFFAREAGQSRPLPATHILMPGQSITFFQRITGVPQDVREVQLMRDGNVVATLDRLFDEYQRTQLYLFKSGLISDLMPGVPLPAGAERFEGEWVTSTNTRLTLTREGDLLRGRLFPGGGSSPIPVVAHASTLDNELILRLQNGAGEDIDHLFLQTQSSGMVTARRVFDTRPLPRNIAARDLAWSASRPSPPPTQPQPPQLPTPEPTPPTPTPPVEQPRPEPTPPVVQPAPPQPQPRPPVPTEPVPVEPTPPVVQPTPPQPTPTPTPPRPTPPTPTPPASGASEIGAQGGYQGISQTWDVKFDGARVERDSEIHVFVTVKNRSTSDQYITPGTFIPNLANQDGETITSRAVFRASGATPTEFRPTVPADGEVRVRFIFRPDAGSAQPGAFTLESFGHRKLTFDVSALRVGSLAQ